MMLWILGGIVVLGAIAAFALLSSISNNGPRLLSAIDRVAGGAQDVRHRATIAYGDHPAQKLAIWGPDRFDPASTPAPVLLFVHGGGWRNGDPLGYGFIARAFVPRGFVVISAGYRLGEEGRYPLMLEDTARAIAAAREAAAEHGGDPDRITLAGHSAGAYNVVMAALEPRWLAAHGLNPADLAGVVGLAGPYDFAPFDTDSTLAAFGHVADADATQPIAHVRADAPPILLLHGERDTLVRLRNTRILAERIAAAGGRVTAHVYPQMDHNDPIIALAAPWRSRRDVATRIAEFARSAGGETRASGAISVPVQAR